MRAACRVLLEVGALQWHRVVPHDPRVAQVRVLDADVLRLIVGAVAGALEVGAQPAVLQ